MLDVADIQFEELKTEATRSDHKWLCKHDLSMYLCPVCSTKMSEHCEHGIRKNSCSRCTGAPSIAKRMLERARERARKKGFECSITFRDIYDKVIETKGFCPVLGTKMQMGDMKSSHRDNCPALDRHDNNKGYTKENCSVISMKANRLKSNANAAELRAVAGYAERVTTISDDSNRPTIADNP